MINFSLKNHKQFKTEKNHLLKQKDVCVFLVYVILKFSDMIVRLMK